MNVIQAIVTLYDLENNGKKGCSHSVVFLPNPFHFDWLNSYMGELVATDSQLQVFRDKEWAVSPQKYRV